MHPVKPVLVVAMRVGGAIDDSEFGSRNPTHSNWLDWLDWSDCLDCACNLTYLTSGGPPAAPNRPPKSTFPACGSGLEGSKNEDHPGTFEIQFQPL